jgi:hypothetical protein
MNRYDDADGEQSHPTSIADIPYEVLTGSLLPILDIKGTYLPGSLG